MYNKFNEVGDYFVNTFQQGSGGDGTSTAPYKTIAQAITAVGTQSGKRIIIAGGGLIQEDCSVINGVPRTSSNSTAIVFVFDSGYAKTDCSMSQAFMVMSNDTVYNMQWLNGSLLYDISAIHSSFIYNTMTLYNCVLDGVRLPAGIGYVINVYNSVVKRCLFPVAGGYSQSTRLTNCVIVDTQSRSAAHNISALSTYVGRMQSGAAMAVTSLGDCCCMAGAVVDAAGYTIVDEPSFVDAVMLRYNSLEGCSLIGKGSADPILGIRRNCGIPGVARKSLSTDPVWMVANGAVYNNIEPDGEGGFRLVEGAYYGTVESAPVVYDKYTLLDNVKLNISTVMVDGKPLVNSDAVRAEHISHAGAASAVEDQVYLNANAIGVQDYYVGMTLHILSGSGVAGAYDITAYDHVSKLVSISGNCGATDTTTQYMVESKTVLRYDFLMRFCGRGDDIATKPYAAYEINTTAYYSVNDGVVSGNADVGYVPAARRQPVATTYQFKIAINNREYGA